MNNLNVRSKQLVSMLLIAAALLSSVLVSAAANAMEAPDAVVKRTVDTIVKNIQANRDQYVQDTQTLYTMVDQVLVPTIHVDRMAGLILGKQNSKLATPAQKRAFADEFKTFLMRSYATALLEYTGSEKVVYEPINLAPGADKVTIKAKLVASDGQSYPIKLFMSNRRDTQWRAYNVEVASINFVGTYRATFGDIIERKGIDGLIKDLRDKNTNLAG